MQILDKSKRTRAKLQLDFLTEVLGNDSVSTSGENVARELHGMKWECVTQALSENTKEIG